MCTYANAIVSKEVIHRSNFALSFMLRCKTKDKADLFCLICCNENTSRHCCESRTISTCADQQNTIWESVIEFIALMSKSSVTWDSDKK